MEECVCLRSPRSKLGLCCQTREWTSCGSRPSVCYGWRQINGTVSSEQRKTRRWYWIFWTTYGLINCSYTLGLEGHCMQEMHRYKIHIGNCASLILETVAFSSGFGEWQIYSPKYAIFFLNYDHLTRQLDKQDFIKQNIQCFQSIIMFLCLWRHLYNGGPRCFVC